MEKNNIQKILNYYLEYEIYNIANSSQIKVDENNSYIINGNIISKSTNLWFTKSFIKIENETIIKQAINIDFNESEKPYSFVI